MSYDQEQAIASAFHAVTEVSRVLRDAIHNQQEFTVDVEASDVEGRLDGGCEIRISVKPPLAGVPPRAQQAFATASMSH
jgi:hypothetical protein